MKTTEFWVPGTPRPAGSKRAFPIRNKAGAIVKTVVTDACAKTKDWQCEVKHAAVTAWGNAALLEGPLRLELVFVVVRPKGHHRTGKNAALLREGAPAHPITKPDVLKLTRAVEDALTGIVWRDDSQVVTESLRKRYGDKPGVMIRISEEVD